MSVQPLITFKAGKCELTGDGPQKVKPVSTRGYVYLFHDDDFVHFCWRPRDKSADEPELKLLMIPDDATFLPYTGSGTIDYDNIQENPKSPTAGRVFVLKFTSSSQRYLFWMQSKSQGNPDTFSERDLKIGAIVNELLNGGDVDVHAELGTLTSREDDDDDDDEAMEDVEGTDHSPNRRPSGTGGAGPDATGGDIREEGEESREGGADGGRAAAGGVTTDAQRAVQDFLSSLGGGSGGGQQTSEDPFTTLLDLLSPNITVPVIDKAPPALVDALCANLPPVILLLAQEIDDIAEVDPTSDTAQAAIEALDQDGKKDILKRVLRSPQMRQSLGSLTVALRDGGLPNVSQALKIDVENGGYMRGQGMPLGGGDAVKAFVEGVKETVEKEGKGDEMDTS